MVVHALRLASYETEQLSKLADKFAPDLGPNLQTFENGRRVRRRRALLASRQLPGCPVEQLPSLNLIGR